MYNGLFIYWSLFNQVNEMYDVFPYRCRRGKMVINRNEIIEKFNEISMNYDEQRRKLIPCFDDFYTIPVSIATTKQEKPYILDLGAGTGLLSAIFLQKYPQAHLTLIDLSEKMLDVAKERLKNYEDITYICDDYTNHTYDLKYDLIISSLSIHHLTAVEKKKLYAKVYTLLQDEGIFINADQVLGATLQLDDLYKKDWKEKVESSGLSEKEILSAYERTKLDKMSSLDEQMQWLTEAGFSDVDVMYKYYKFVILYGKKGK